MESIRNQWYVATASSQLKRKPRAARVLDLELALFRDAAGVAHALLDRCSHRGVRLSLGRIANGTVACGYHGWRFDGTGACVHVPSLAKGRRIAKGCEVPSFKTAEQDGYVWIWVGDDPPATLPARIPDFDRFRWIQGSIDTGCDALKLIENNLDWCHPYFAHPNTHTQYFEIQKNGWLESQYEMRITQRGLQVFTPITNSESEPIPHSPIALLSYEIPDRVTVEFDSPRKKRLRIVLHVVPTGTNTCRLEWLVAPNPVPFLGGHVLWTSREPKILRQDRLLLESSQPWYDRQPDAAFERSVEADSSTLMFRRIYSLAVSGTWNEKWSSLPQRRVVDVSLGEGSIEPRPPRGRLVRTLLLLLAAVAACETSNAVITGTPVGGEAAPAGTAPGISSSGGAGVIGGSTPPLPNTATGGTPSAVPALTAGTSGTAGGQTQTGMSGGASGSTENPPAANGCRASTYSLAVRLTADVSWGETAGLLEGTGKAHFWSKLTIEPSASKVSELRTCGNLLPVHRGSALAGNKLSFQQVPQASFDLPTMPRLSGGSATRVDSRLTLDPGFLTVGLMLTDPAAPWPASSTAPNVMLVDADGDGKPGITVQVRIDDVAGFAAPPTSILQFDRVDAYYTASRTRYRATLNDAACADALEGSAELLATDNLMIGCHVKDKQDCKPEEAQFLRDGRPMLVFAPAAVIRAVVIPVDATCAQVIQTLDVPAP